LFRACVAHGLELMLPPNPATWEAIDDPRERLRAALLELYAYSRQTEAAWANIFTDLPRMPAPLQANEPAVLALWGQMRETLLRGWRVRGRGRTERRWLIELALQFYAWRALAQSGASDEEAAALVSRLASCLARGNRRPPRSDTGVGPEAVRP
jgi:hypothetical protein